MAKINEWTAEEMKLRNKFAELAHDVWGEWMRYMFSLCGETTDGDIVIPAEKVARWARQMATPYEQLSEAEKASDIVIAARYLELVAEPLRLSRLITNLGWDMDVVADVPVNHRSMMRDEPTQADADIANVVAETAEIARLNAVIEQTSAQLVDAWQALDEAETFGELPYYGDEMTGDMHDRGIAILMDSVGVLFDGSSGPSADVYLAELLVQSIAAYRGDALPYIASAAERAIAEREDNG